MSRLLEQMVFLTHSNKIGFNTVKPLNLEANLQTKSLHLKHFANGLRSVNNNRKCESKKC